MKNIIVVFILLFTVTVEVPWGVKVKYKQVQDVILHPSGFTYTLTLSDGRIAQVPSQWTVVEEEK